jgi:hypothetical protein
VTGRFVLAVAIPVVDRDLDDDERLGFGHDRSPRLGGDVDNLFVR